MSEINVTVMLPGGDVCTAAMPDNLTMSELLPDLLSALQLPILGPDSRPVGYRLVSRGLGRALAGDETLASARLPAWDRLILTAALTAGSSLSDSPRMRRLRADHERMIELAAHSALIQIRAKPAPPGMPPEEYVVTYKVRSVIGIDREGRPKMGEHHQVEIYLHSDYPQRWPGLKWLTPIWHPNINHVNGSVCIDAAWWGAARSLDRLTIMMGEMLEYKNFHDDPNTPPFPWDKEAAEWCRAYRQKHPDFIPTDTRELLRPERVKLGPTSPNKPRIKLK